MYEHILLSKVLHLMEDDFCYLVTDLARSLVLTIVVTFVMCALDLLTLFYRDRSRMKGTGNKPK